MFKDEKFTVLFKFLFAWLIALLIGLFIGYNIKNGEVTTLRTKLNETIDLNTELAKTADNFKDSIEKLPKRIADLQRKLKSISEENRRLTEDHIEFIKRTTEYKTRIDSDLSKASSVTLELQRENKRAIVLIKTIRGQ